MSRWSVFACAGLVWISGDQPGNGGTLEPAIAVLYSHHDPKPVQTADVSAPHRRIPLEGFQCDERIDRAATVILSGHSLPPEYLHHDPTSVAAAIACLRPELVVLNTCYGFSEPLLQALASTGQAPYVVGSTLKLPPRGLEFDEGFYTARTAEARACFVRARSGARLEAWRLDPAQLDRAATLAAGWDPDTLRRGLKRRDPNLVFVALNGASMLMAVPPERFRPSTSPQP